MPLMDLRAHWLFCAWFLAAPGRAAVVRVAPYHAPRASSVLLAAPRLQPLQPADGALRLSLAQSPAAPLAVVVKPAAPAAAVLQQATTRLAAPKDAAAARPRPASDLLFDGTRIELVPMDDGFETAHEGREQLGGEATRKAVAARLKSLKEDAAGVPETAQDHAARLDGARRAAAVRRSDAYAAYKRLETSASRMEAFLDPAEGRVLLRERVMPAPPELTSRVDARAGFEILSRMMQGSASAAVKRSFAAALAAAVPLRALQLLERTGLRYWITEGMAEVSHASPTFVTRYGPAAAAYEEHGGAVHQGQFDSSVNEIHASSQGHGLPRARVSVLLHETMHALDFALGNDGRGLSASAPWDDIFIRTRNDHALKRKDGLAFPSDRAQADAAEFFAESGAMFLSAHLVSYRSADEARTRADLAENNAPAFAFMERLFTTALDELDFDAADWTPNSPAPEFMRLAKANRDIPNDRKGGAAWFLAAKYSFQAASLFAAEGSIAPARTQLRLTAKALERFFNDPRADPGLWEIARQLLRDGRNLSKRLVRNGPIWQRVRGVSFRDAVRQSSASRLTGGIFPSVGARRR